MRLPTSRLLLCTALLVSKWSLPVSAQAPAPAEQDLAKQLSNPVSSLVSMPFQFNWEQNVGPSKLTRFVLNVQPVVPFAVNPRWNMIVRIIAPLISQPPLTDGGVAASGNGDITTSFFFASAKPSKVMVGVGPEFVLPSTSQPTLGSGKWSAGPTIVVVRQSGAVTFGALWNQVWSFSGDPARGDVNQMFLQPFVAYQATHTITLNLQSEMTANWEVDDGRWTVPISVTVSKLSSFGTFPASYQLSLGGYPVHSDIGPSWKLRATITLLLPKVHPE
jgi:hypothetical protein